MILHLMDFIHKKKEMKTIQRYDNMIKTQIFADDENIVNDKLLLLRR